MSTIFKILASACVSLSQIAHVRFARVRFARVTRAGKCRSRQICLRHKSWQMSLASDLVSRYLACAIRDQPRFADTKIIGER